MNTVKNLRIPTNGQDLSTFPVNTSSRSWPATTSAEHHKVIKEPQVVRVDRTVWTLMDRSYRNDLWAAGYLINGGCSDDGFDYFRGWRAGDRPAGRFLFPGQGG
jgi:hypothetical protein